METSLNGEFAGLYSPTGKLQSTAKITFSVGNSEQEVKLILTLAGLIKPLLELYGNTQTRVETEDRITFEEAVEVS